MERTKVMAVLAVVFAVAAAVSAGMLGRTFFPQRTVLVLASDVGPRSFISKEAVRKAVLPAAGLPPDALADEGALAGKVTRGFMPAGTVVREAFLQPRWAAGAAGTLAEIGAGYRLVALPLSAETTVGGVVANGDRIDIYALRPGEPAAPIVTDVLVYSGPGMPSTPPGKGLAALGGGGQQAAPQALVVALRSEDVEKVMAAIRDGGRIVAALRPLEGGGA